MLYILNHMINLANDVTGAFYDHVDRSLTVKVSVWLSKVVPAALASSWKRVTGLTKVGVVAKHCGKVRAAALRGHCQRWPTCIQV